MKNLITILLLTLSQIPTVYSDVENTALEAIKALFPTLSKSQQLKTQGCSFQKEKWGAIILTKQSFEESITFNKNCDLQGKFEVQMDKFFPINLKVKKHKQIKKIIGNLKMGIVFEELPLLKLDMKDSIIIGEKNISFDMNYGVYIDPLNKDPLRKHKGGSVFIKKHGTQLINKKFPLKFN
jgi:hypothetical protein